MDLAGQEVSQTPDPAPSTAASSSSIASEASAASAAAAAGSFPASSSASFAAARSAAAAVSEGRNHGASSGGAGRSSSSSGGAGGSRAPRTNRFVAVVPEGLTPGAVFHVKTGPDPATGLYTTSSVRGGELSASEYCQRGRRAGHSTCALLLAVSFPSLCDVLGAFKYHYCIAPNQATLRAILNIARESYCRQHRPCRSRCPQEPLAGRAL